MGFGNLLNSDNQDWVMPTANSNIGTYAEYMQNNPEANANNGTDYLSRINAIYGSNPGTLEDYLVGKVPEFGDTFTPTQDATNEYNARLAKYQQGRDFLASQAPQKGQSYTEEQIAQMTGSPLNKFTTYQGIPVAVAANQFAENAGDGWGGYNQFIQNPDGTYKVANLGGINPDVRVNAPRSTNWTDYMDAAITAATIAGNAYVAPQALGALFAPAGAVGMDAYMASAGLNPGTFEGAAFTLPEFASSAPIGDQPGDYPMPGEDGTAPEWKPSNINPTDVDNLLNYNASYANPTSLSDILKNANDARKAYNIVNSLANLGKGAASGVARTTGGTTGGTSSADLSKIANLLTQPQQTNSFIGQIKANQNPFFGGNQGTLSGGNVYDVSGSNPMANALRKK